MKIRLERLLSSLPAPLAFAALLGVLLSAACGSDTQTAEQESGPEEAKASSFELPEARGGMMSLSQLLEGRDALALVFYRGFF